MRVWERHSAFAVPFVILGAGLRRGAEAIRLLYWRRAFGWEIGRNVRVHFTVHIPRKMRVSLGDGVGIGKGTEVWSEIPGAVFALGANTNIARNCMLDASGGLSIGANVTVSEEAAIYTHSHGRNPRSKPAYHPLSIEDDVWICTRAIVLASVRTIGARAIIGPYAVVRKPVPEGSLIVRGESETQPCLRLEARK